MRSDGLVVEVDGDRIALDRVDVHPIAQLRSQRPAGGTSADHHAVELKGFVAAWRAEDDAGLPAIGRHAFHILTVPALDTQANGRNKLEMQAAGSSKATSITQ